MKKLCSLVTALLLLCSTVAIRADTIDQALFKQTVLFTNNTEEVITPKMDNYKFSIKEVSEEELTPITEGIAVYAGDLDKVTLKTTEMSFSDVKIPANTVDYEVSQDIEIEFGEFATPGDYRYILSNDTLDEQVYFNVRVFNGEDGKCDVGGCVFFDTADCKTKTSDFTSSYLLNGEDPVEMVYKVIFRFVDPDGNKLTDDILFNKKEVVKQPVNPEPIRTYSHGPNINVTTLQLTTAGEGYVLGASRAIDYSEKDALDLYASTLKTFKEKGYEVVTDEIAGHTGSWYSDDPNVTMIYTVTLKKIEPTNTPVPTDTSTVTPIPTGTPKTGDDFNIPLVTGIVIGSGCLCLVFVGMILKKKQENEQEE